MNDKDNVKRIDPIKGVIDTFSMMKGIALGREVPGRDDVFNDVIGDQTVDTVCPFDTHGWETGIKRNQSWVIVEQYSSREEAVVGHAKWVAAITAEPVLELKDINVWGL